MLDPKPPAIDPIIQGLLARLPESGGVWPEAERKLWLQLLEGSFKLIYRNGDEAPLIRPANQYDIPQGRS